MAYDRFLIAPINSGLQTNLKSWLIPDDAYAKLQNAYVFRGRVRKRFGSRYMGYGWATDQTAQLNSRLRILLGVTDGANNITGTVPGNVFKVGQMFSIGTVIFTVTSLGNPSIMLDTDGSLLSTYDTTTGAYNITSVFGTPGTSVYFYPAEPVMGIDIYQDGPINDQPTFAFDTQFAYEFISGSWQRSGTTVWHSTDTDFFWVANYQGFDDSEKFMFVTNYKATVGVPGVNDDDMYYYDGTSWTNFSNLTVFNSAGDRVATARIIIPFKNRLLLLNCIEQDSGATTNTAYVNRCRYSHVGSPVSVVISGLNQAPYAWLRLDNSYTVGAATGHGDGAGFVDAATSEQIISAEFIKDRLIVYFERSTWELAYTGNQVEPFVWQKLNTELGSESALSTVPFDQEVLTIGNTGVHSCNGSNVSRIDFKIPDQIFKVRNKNLATRRIGGIRDYYAEMVYWTFASFDASVTQTFPNRVMVYNYQNGSWAFNDDCITAFGYFEQQQDLTWETATQQWQDMDTTWTDGIIPASARQILAGNQQGYVYVIDTTLSRNAAVMQITDINTTTAVITIINHNLVDNDCISIEDGTFGFPGTSSLEIVKIKVIDADTVSVEPESLEDFGKLGGLYLGGGVASRVSRIDILSKRWNPYVSKGQNVYLAKIDFGVDRTESGEITIDYYPSSSDESMITAGQATGALLGNNILETSPYDLVPLEQQQELLWHPIYFQSSGEFIQIRMFLDDPQLLNEDIAWEDFQLEGLVLHTQKTSYRLQ